MSKLFGILFFLTFISLNLVAEEGKYRIFFENREELEKGVERTLATPQDVKHLRITRMFKTWNDVEEADLSFIGCFENLKYLRFAVFDDDDDSFSNDDYLDEHADSQMHALLSIPPMPLVEKLVIHDAYLIKKSWRGSEMS